MYSKTFDMIVRLKKEKNFVITCNFIVESYTESSHANVILFSVRNKKPREFRAESHLNKLSNSCGGKEDKHEKVLCYLSSMHIFQGFSEFSR